MKKLLFFILIALIVCEKIEAEKLDKVTRMSVNELIKKLKPYCQIILDLLRKADELAIQFCCSVFPSECYHCKYAILHWK